MDAGIPEMLLVEGTSAEEEEALVGAFAGLMLARELPPYGCINLEVYYLSSSCLMIALNTVKLRKAMSRKLVWFVGVVVCGRVSEVNRS